MKKEKKADLEQLLNSLIEKGWKPRGKNYGVVDFLGILVFVDLNDGRLSSKNALDLRKLTSKEIGLWQFVCENGMVEDKGEIRYKADENNDINDANYMSEFYYWLLESSLKDESELEDFLLNSIKLD